MNNLQKPYMNAVKIENLRKILIDAGKYEKALDTYQKQRFFLNDENTSEFWDEKFTNEIVKETVHPMEDWRINEVINIIDPNKTVVNLGVGKGKLEKILLYKYKNINYIGTDITKQTLDRLSTLYGNEKFRCETLTNLTFPDNSVEQVLLLEVLEHITPDNTFRVLLEIKRILRKNGTFIISVPINEHLEKMLPMNPNSHMRLYNENLIKFELLSAGFKIREIHRASAFNKFFEIKNYFNNKLFFKEFNNIIIICSKI